ncbi:MAG: pyrroline-5-carboxylate reductase [Fusobacteria bacterium]|nr:MAG: pyrroline-5-carboxylate reductase [Fusobacteriota bacterium]KAF0229932.1 MAG: pyrroline-5-carboxylate [Fusobacteriota bacterium]
MRIGFIGSGNMAEAIIAGMIKSDFPAKDILILDINQERIDLMVEKHKVSSTDVDSFFLETDIIVLAVKPQIIEKVLTNYKMNIKKDHLIISIAAGIKIDKILSLSASEKIVRVMPNTPALISMGISALTYKSKLISDSEKIQVESIMKSIGEFVWLEENQMDAVTALSGSGPAYVYRFVDAMIDSGVLIGLTRDLARKLVVQTVLGSTMMLKSSNMSPKELESQVTSPGGTTIHGLVSMEKNNFSSSVKEGVKAAYERAVELGKENK